MNRLSRIDRAALLDCALAATPGHWTQDRNDVLRPDGVRITMKAEPRNARFIAAANPNVVVSLLDYVAGLEAKLAAVQTLWDEGAKRAVTPEEMEAALATTVSRYPRPGVTPDYANSETLGQAIGHGLYADLEASQAPDYSQRSARSRRPSSVGR